MFKRWSFKALRGETFNGVVKHVYRSGVLLQCGPIKLVFISNRKMPGYALENPHPKNRCFVANNQAAIEVIDKRWNKNNFEVLGSFDGESLGSLDL